MIRLINGGNVDVLFTCVEYVFRSLGSWSCAEEKVWG